MVEMTGEPSLTGQTVLVLEDDFYLAEDASGALRGAGAEVIGPCPSTAAAIKAIQARSPTAAIVDINLGTGPSFEMARVLRKAGTPFVFLTGYDQAVIPAEFEDVARLQKPVQLRHVVRAVAALRAA
jgi:DNA-binding LytR/AlgR family response regulator